MLRVRVQLIKNHGFRKEGYSEEQIWNKYAGCLPSELPEGSTFQDEVYYTILTKACSTNKHVDKLCDRGVWSVVTSVTDDIVDAAARAATLIL